MSPCWPGGEVPDIAENDSQANDITSHPVPREDLRSRNKMFLQKDISWSKLKHFLQQIM